MTDCKVNHSPSPAPETFWIVVSSANYGGGKRYDDLTMAFDAARAIAIKAAPARAIIMESKYVSEPLTALVTLRPVAPQTLRTAWNPGGYLPAQL